MFMLVLKCPQNMTIFHWDKKHLKETFTSWAPWKELQYEHLEDILI